MFPKELRFLLFVVTKLWKVLSIGCKLPHAGMVSRPLLCGIRLHTLSNSRGLHQLFETRQSGSWTHSAAGSQRWKCHLAYTNNMCSFCTCIQKRQLLNTKESNNTSGLFCGTLLSNLKCASTISRKSCWPVYQLLPNLKSEPTLKNFIFDT